MIFSWQYKNLPYLLAASALCRHSWRSAATLLESVIIPRRLLADSAETTRVYKATPLGCGVSGSARLTVSDRDLNLKWHLLLTSAVFFRCLPTSHLVPTQQGLVWSIFTCYYSPHLSSSSEPIQRRRNRIINVIFCCGGGFHSTIKKTCLFSIMSYSNKRFQSEVMG